MHEYIANLHMHTPYSDGFGSHAEIANAALQAGIDVVIVTDHNVLVRGPEGYYRDKDKRTLLIIGQEVHDQARQPQKNHLLVLGAGRDVATYAYEPQRLIDAARQAGGLTYFAHPWDPAAPAINEDDLGWVSWEVEHFTGIEIWNALSEFKGRIKSKFHALYYVFNPAAIARGPFPEVLEKWDALLALGKKVSAVGGSDAHAIPVRWGLLRRTVFPYSFHFRGVNTHFLTPEPLIGDPVEDRRAVLEAFRAGRTFVGYDLPASTCGFRFTAQGQDHVAWMGDEIDVHNGITFQIRLPVATKCRLLRNGTTVRTWEKRPTCTYITTEAGAYRVEVTLPFRGRERGWIYSNPIYIKAG